MSLFKFRMRLCLIALGSLGVLTAAVAATTTPSDKPASSNAAAPAIKVEMKCDSPWALQGLTQTIMQTNNIDARLKFYFDDIKLVKPKKKDDARELRCQARLKLIDTQTQAITDNLKLNYHIKANGDPAKPETTYNFNFEPVR